MLVTVCSVRREDRIGFQQMRNTIACSQFDHMVQIDSHQFHGKYGQMGLMCSLCYIVWTKLTIKFVGLRESHNRIDFFQSNQIVKPKLSLKVGGRLRELRPNWVKISPHWHIIGNCRYLPTHVVNVLFMIHGNFKN